MDDDADDIAQWAANLTPEGAPGAMSQRMREILGDEGYEKAVAQNDAVAALYIQRYTSINNILVIIQFFSTIFGLVGFVAAVTLVAHMIFG